MSWNPPEDGRWVPDDAERWKGGVDPRPADGFSWLESAFDDLLDEDEAETADLDVSDEAILQGIIEHRGTAVAREYVSLLALPGLEDPDSWETRHLLARLREMSERHGLTADERLYILEEILDGLDLEVGKRDPMYFELEAAMDKARHAGSSAGESIRREAEESERKLIEQAHHDAAPSPEQPRPPSVRPPPHGYVGPRAPAAADGPRFSAPQPVRASHASGRSPTAPKKSLGCGRLVAIAIFLVVLGVAAFAVAALIVRGI